MLVVRVPESTPVESWCQVRLHGSLEGVGRCSRLYGTGEVCQISVNTRLCVVIAICWHFHPIDRIGRQIVQ